jgi:hypothetical protein
MEGKGAEMEIDVGATHGQRSVGSADPTGSQLSAMSFQRAAIGKASLRAVCW